jgi:hypothetical protein
MLKALSPAAQAVFDHLTRDLDLGGARKIDNATGAFMAVCIDRLTERHYSIAHYYEQGSDQMCDPDMTFFKSADGKVYPCSFQQDSLAIYRVGLDITPDGTIEAENAREQADQADFANQWMRNIADQQRLTIQVPGADEPERSPE